jgi:hypothetical protein
MLMKMEMKPGQKMQGYSIYRKKSQLRDHSWSSSSIQRDAEGMERKFGVLESLYGEAKHAQSRLCHYCELQVRSFCTSLLKHTTMNRAA